MMINNETRRKLEELSLSEFIQALELQEKEPTYQTLSFEERLQLIVDYTYQEKYTNKVKRLSKMQNSDILRLVLRISTILTDSLIETRFYLFLPVSL